MNFLVPIHPHLNLLHHWKTILVWSGQILKSKKKTREIKIYTVKIQRENKIFRNGSTGERSISKITSLSPLPSTHLSPCYTVLGTLNRIITRLKYLDWITGFRLLCTYLWSGIGDSYPWPLKAYCHRRVWLMWVQKQLLNFELPFCLFHNVL